MEDVLNIFTPAEESVEEEIAPIIETKEEPKTEAKKTTKKATTRTRKTTKRIRTRLIFLKHNFKIPIELTRRIVC